jgi:hypothetical protein
MQMGANADEFGSPGSGDTYPNGRILRETFFTHQKLAK